MALSDVLNNLTGARDALVTAINGKGGSVATTATLRQCAAAVTALPGGGEAWEAPEGAALYLPLSAPFGLNPTNTVNFGEVSGIQCASFSGNACFNLQTKPFSGTGDFSISIWEKFDESNANEFSQAFFFGNAAASRCVGFHWVNSTGKFSLNTFNSDEAKNINVQIETKSWHHIAAVYSSGTLKLFVDNALNGYATVSLDIGSNTSTVGGLGGDSERNWAGELAGLRVYDRAITEAEISTLYDEFKSATGSGGDDRGSGESGGGEGGGSSIYTGDLVATIYGTPLGDLTLSLSNTYHSPPSQTDASWRGEWAGGITNLYWSSGKWYLDISGNIQGEVLYGGDSFETSNDVPWGATWTSNYETSHTCEVSKA